LSQQTPLATEICVDDHKMGAWVAVAEILEIFVHDLVVMADIGIHDHEVGHAQKLLVSISVEVAPFAQDDIHSTVDYTKLAAHAQRLGRQRIGLIETYAGRLGALCMADPAVFAATVNVRKPAALVSGTAGVRYKFRRSSAR
jgi:dihydroneopterin aldolase